jgi:hypothetical protein
MRASLVREPGSGGSEEGREPTPAGSARNRAAAWLRSLAEAELEELASDFAEGLERDGVCVHDGKTGEFKPIPAVLSPEPIAEEKLNRASLDARALLSAAVKAARWTLSPEGAALAPHLYGSFTPFERSCVWSDPARLEQIATARVDFLLREDEELRALEINATIPAMQGYSDLLSRRWLRTLAQRRGMGARATEQLISREASNTDDLLDSLLAHYRLAGGSAERPSLLTVSRRGDAQLSELRHYQLAFAERGIRALHAWADEVEIDSRGRASLRGEPFDLVYRHIFARLVDPSSALARLLQEPGPSLVLNPVASPLEAKGLLALLHETAADEERSAALGLAHDECDSIRRSLSWTRLLDGGASTGPDGRRLPDLAAWVVAHPDEVVLKRSWDYGGRSVVLGPERDSDASRARFRELFGPECSSWRDFVARAASDPDAWVVQEYVPSRPRRHLLIERSETGRPRARWRELLVDLSAYTSLGVEPRPRGGVCRASSSPIVNILAGGGLAPLISSAAIDALFPG